MTDLAKIVVRIPTTQLDALAHRNKSKFARDAIAEKLEREKKETV